MFDVNTAISSNGTAFQGWHYDPPFLSGIPPELTYIPQWVVWEAKPKPSGGMNKIPYQPNGRKASTDKPDTWSDFSAVWAAYQEDPEKYAGVGFVLTQKDAFVGGDLDHCRNFETGELTPGAASIVSQIGTYWEVSPSGTGLRFIARGEQVRAFKGNGVEVYTSGRYLTITGTPLPHSPSAVWNISSPQLERLRELAGAKPQAPHTDSSRQDLVVEKLKARNLYLQAQDNGRHKIVCPWGEEHTGGDKTGTVYMEANYNGYASARFVCQHSHCGNRTLKDLEAYLHLSGNTQTTGTKPDATFPFVYASEMADIAPTEFLVEGWIEERGVALLYAPKDTYKSFLAVDWFLSSLTGEHWHGFETKKTAGVYIAGEGFAGLRKRIKAWCVRHGIESIALQMAVSKLPMQVLDEGNAAQWAGHIHQVQEHLGESVGFIVIDTLSTNFGTGDENKPSDMARFLSYLRIHLQSVLDCAILVVHHTGKNVDLGARGGSSLEGNADAVFTLKREPEEERRVVLSCKHIKDEEPPPDMPFEARTVELGINNRFGEPLTSLVLDSVLTTREQAVLNNLKAGKSRREIAGFLGMKSHNTVNRIVRNLKNRRLV